MISKDHREKLINNSLYWIKDKLRVDWKEDSLVDELFELYSINEEDSNVTITFMFIPTGHWYVVEFDTSKNDKILEIRVLEEISKTTFA